MRQAAGAIASLRAPWNERRRVQVAIMLYELELRPDGTYECTTFIGLETMIDPVPEGLSAEEAYDARVHPDDREVYDGAVERLAEGAPLEVEYRLIGSSGEELWVLDRMRPERRTEDGTLIVGGVVADISERKRVEAEARQQLAHAALHDSLTGLANRAAFLEQLELGLKRATRTGAGTVLLFIDLDNFKHVNDSYGHAAGDELLKAVGTRLRAEVRETDVVACQGGDEFLILLNDVATSAAEVVADKVRNALREPFVIDGTEIRVSASIGIGLYPVDSRDAEGRRRR